MLIWLELWESMSRKLCFEIDIVIVTNGLLLFAVGFILSFILDFLSFVSAVRDHALSSETND